MTPLCYFVNKAAYVAPINSPFLHPVIHFLLQSAVFMLPLLGALHVIVYAAAGRKWGLMALGLLLAAFFILVFKPLATLLPHLAMDSFREGLSFDPGEAYFYLTTLGYTDYGLKNLVVWGALFLGYAGCVVLLVKGLRAKKFPLSSPKVHGLLALLLIVPSTAYAGGVAISGFSQASDQLAEVAGNFDGNADGLAVMADPDNDLTVMLYIGESAARPHWGIYGYPRATTRALEDPKWSSGLIRFDRVSSASVHTSPSLLEALSITMPGQTSSDTMQSVYEQQRIPVTEALAKAGIGTTLYSNQGRHGTWNMASEILFREAQQRRYSTSRVLGSADYLDDQRPYDHAFLDQFWADYQSQKIADSRFLVFHSYAGHAGFDGYAGHIPEGYRNPIDGFLAGLTTQAILGAEGNPADVQGMEDYDAAMRYVADNLADTFAQADAQDRPMAVVFVSDHGESVSTGLGHDSARYLWEMSAVPMVVYFNRAAREQYPDRVAEIRALAREGRPASLANLPSFLFDLLGVEARGPDGSAHRASRCGFAEGDCLPAYRNVRTRVDGTVSYVRTPQTRKPPAGALDTTDRASALANLVLASNGEQGRPQMCFHRANSIASIVRARAITPCLEMDVVVDGPRVFVHHSSAPNVGLTLDKALEAVGNPASTIWLDGKNLDDPMTCAVLANTLERRRGDNFTFFVEFPSGSAERLDDVRPCAERLKSGGAALSYYVPTDAATQCSAAIKAGRGTAACGAFERQLDEVLQSGMFSDISFDYAALPAIQNHPDAKSVRWNTWFIPDADILSLPPERYRLVLPFGADPNAN